MLVIRQLNPWPSNWSASPSLYSKWSISPVPVATESTHLVPPTTCTWQRRARRLSSGNVAYNGECHCKHQTPNNIVKLNTRVRLPLKVKNKSKKTMTVMRFKDGKPLVSVERNDGKLFTDHCKRIPLITKKTTSTILIFLIPSSGLFHYPLTFYPFFMFLLKVASLDVNSLRQSIKRHSFNLIRPLHWWYPVCLRGAFAWNDARSSISVEFHCSSQLWCFVDVMTLQLYDEQETRGIPSYETPQSCDSSARCQLDTGVQ